VYDDRVFSHRWEGLMAYIGKDGKDDSCRIASLGASSVQASLSRLGKGATTRYYRANYSLQNAPSPDLMASHVEFAEKMTLVGYVDCYGATAADSPFVVFNASSSGEAQALAEVSPLAVTGGATVSIQTLDTGVSIWS
jgi:hypothetical protein